MAGNEYGEQYQGRHGSVVTLTVYVPWTLRHDFVRAVMPDVELDPKIFTEGVRRLKRYLPEPHPEFDWLYVTGADVRRPVGAPAKPAPGDTRFLWKQHGGDDALAQIVLTYRSLNYHADVEDAAAHQNPERELSRYVSRTATPSGEAIQVSGKAFRFVPGGPEDQIGNEAPAMVLPTADLRYTCHYWPREALPHAVLGATQAFPTIPAAAPPVFVAFLGKANGSAFDTEALADDTYAPGTLVYVACEISEPYYTPTGTEVVDFTLVFQYRPDTWYRLFRRRDHDFVEATRDRLNDASLPFPLRGAAGESALQDGRPAFRLPDGISRHMFEYCSFYSLFRPGPAATLDLGAFL